MAEFAQVMRQAKRMCNGLNDCDECQLRDVFDVVGCPFAYDSVDMRNVEKPVMDWAAAHPEPRYPSWGDVWRQLFPDASNAPCPLHFVPAHMVNEYCRSPRQCAICRQQPIPADIAEKLGIKPMGGSAE